MICPQCEAAGERSRVYPGVVSVTAMGWQPYYDEDGVYVNNDPNTRAQHFECSNGHKWIDRTTRGETVHWIVRTTSGANDE